MFLIEVNMMLLGRLNILLYMEEMMIDGNNLWYN